MSNLPSTLSSVARRLRASGSVFAEDEARALLSAARTQADLVTMLDKRVCGVPIEHIIGWAEFCGQRVAVEPGVFVPRRRTEFLVRQAVALIRPGDVVVELCTGTGAVAAAIAAATDVGELHATDIDAAAVRNAARNLDAGRVHRGDLFEPLPTSLRARVNVVVANTPYVPTYEVERLPREARLHEPRRALDGGDDGLDIQRRAAAAAPEWLAAGGYLLMETSERQAPETIEIVGRSGLVPSLTRSDELDATVVVGVAAQRSRATRPSSHTASSDS